MSRTASRIYGFAVGLINHEARCNPSAAAHSPPALRVCEKMRLPLATLMGHAGFRALLARALDLASAEVTWLNLVQVRADGSLEGFDPAQAQVTPKDFKADSAVLVAELLGLLVTFIGEKLTIQLLRATWPKLPAVPFEPGPKPSR